ncbi:cell division protein FtsQ/DivIB [Eionea flava]
MKKSNRRIRVKEKKPLSLPLKKIRTVLRILSVTVIGIFLLGVIGFYGARFTQDFLNRPIASIVVKGQFDYVSEQDMTSIAKEMIGGSFIGENISRIKATLEAMPWVDSVDLSRRWPDKLEVIVKEQIPIARWSNDGFVNVRGEIIFLAGDSHLTQLSVLVGEEKDAEIIMQRYSVLASMLSEYGLSIKVLEKSRRGVWRIELANQWKIMIGRGEMNKKLQRFTYLLDQEVLNITMNIDTIDLRYPNGLAVSWKEVESHRQNQEELDEIDTIIKEINSSVYRPTIRQRKTSDKQYARG